MTNFDSQIGCLDLSLFEKIESQSTLKDKKSLLACQLAVRELLPNYRYLEIGSHLGGSIQPHLLDDRCEKIYSIDARPTWQPDARGYEFYYQQNSTDRMIEMLSAVSNDMTKIKTIDGDTRSIRTDVIDEPVQLCFIDGEHTDEAALADFEFCLNVLDDNGAIVFHDSQITYNGLSNAVKRITEEGVPFHAYSLPNAVFVIEVGNFPIHRNARVVERLIDNHESFLYALQENDHYRKTATGFPFGTLQRMKVKLSAAGVNYTAIRKLNPINWNVGKISHGERPLVGAHRTVVGAHHPRNAV